MPLRNWKDLVAESADTQLSFEPLPDGIYDFVVSDAEHRTSGTGKDGFNITATVETGPYAKRRVFNSFWVSPDSAVAMGIFFRQLAALGLDGAFFGQEPSNERIVAALKGARFRGDVVTTEYKDKKRNEFRNILEPNPALATQVSALSGGAPDSVIENSLNAVTSDISSGPSAPTPTVYSVSDNPWANASVPEVPSGAPVRPF